MPLKSLKSVGEVMVVGGAIPGRLLEVLNYDLGKATNLLGPFFGEDLEKSSTDY